MMASRSCQHLLHAQLWTHPRKFIRVQRPFSTAAIYTSFPASLLRYNSRQRSSLYDRKKRLERRDDPNWDGIEVSEDGLVYTGASKDPTLYTGAMLMPNTFTMQENIRTEVDYYFDNEDLGKSMETPFVYSIHKGTPIPSNLVLLREGLSRFSLQSSQPVSLESLNTSLDEFYGKYAEKKTAEQWLAENDFDSAVADDAVAVWMGR